MKAFLLYGLAFALIVAGISTIVLAASLIVYLWDFAPNAPPTGMLIVIALVAMGCYAIQRGGALYQALEMLEKIRKEIRHERATTPIYRCDCSYCLSTFGPVGGRRR